jgi:hypothetical protein
VAPVFASTFSTPKIFCRAATVSALNDALGLTFGCANAPDAMQTLAAAMHAARPNLIFASLRISS